MSSLEGDVPLDLSNGWSWCGGIRIAKAQRSRKAVIWNFWKPGGVELELYVEESARLYFDVSDAMGRNLSVGPVPLESFVDRWIVLIVLLEVETPSQPAAATKATLRVVIDDSPVAEQTGELILGESGTAKFSLGSNQLRALPANFDIDQHGFFARALGEDDLHGMSLYIHSKLPSEERS